jgi:type I restriction enzyme S subunit
MNTAVPESITLKDAGTWLSGGTPRTSEDTYWDGDLPWISAKSLKDFHVRDSDRRLTQLGAENGTRVVEKDAILMVIRGMSLKTEFRMGIATRRLAFSQDCKALIARPGIDPLFLAYAIKARSQNILEMVDEAGHGTGRLQMDLLFGLEIGVPPIREQRSIAATLGALDDKIESNRRQLDLLDQLFQTYWNQCSDTAAEQRHLGDLVSTQYGLTASAESESVGPKFLRVTDINKQNWLSWDAIPTAPVDLAELEKYRLQKGDLVVARMADPGKSAIYDDESAEAVFASYLVRLKTRSWAESLYLYGFLKSPLYANYAAGAMTGSVQKNMNAKVIVAVDLPFPDSAGLQAFTAVAEPIRAAINQKVRENSRLSDLRDVLLPELLSGRIQVPAVQEDLAGISA